MVRSGAVEIRTVTTLRPLSRLQPGADEVVNSRSEEELQGHFGSFNFILDTVSADHDLNVLIRLLGRDGNLVLVGAPDQPPGVSALGPLSGRKSVSGSLIGGM